MNLFVRPTGGGDVVRVTSMVDRDLSGYAWKGDGRLLYLKDEGGDENFALYGVDPRRKHRHPAHSL